MAQKNIVIFGGTHGDEHTGIEIVKALKQKRLKNIIPILANPRAVAKNARYTETDLNRSAGKLIAISYEERRAKQLSRSMAKADLIIEFHNTTARNNSCGIITTKPSALHIGLAKHFGLQRLVVMPEGGSLSGQFPDKTFSLELSVSDPEYSPQRLLQQLESLAQMTFKKAEVQLYSFTGTTVFVSTLKKLNIRLNSLKNFEPIPRKVAKFLRLPLQKIYVPMFIGEKAYGPEFGFQIAEKHR